jgi:hypothetical protein
MRALDRKFLNHEQKISDDGQKNAITASIHSILGPADCSSPDVT